MKKQYIQPVSARHDVMTTHFMALSLIDEPARNDEGYTLDDGSEEGNALVKGAWHDWDVEY